jgi:hypothetical protein
MMPMTDRDSAAELARRIEASLTDPSKADEAGRPPSDKPPAFADALMSEEPGSIEKTVDLNSADCRLIARALQYYAARSA